MGQESREGYEYTSINTTKRMSTRWQPVPYHFVADNNSASGCQHQDHRRASRLTGRTRGAPAYCSQVSAFGYYTALQQGEASFSNDLRRPPGDPTKKAISVEQYFRNTEYSEDLSQSLQKTLRDYNVCALQLELTPRIESLFFINVFGGTPHDYFFEHFREEMTYDELVKVMSTIIDNNARQLSIEWELETLKLEKIMRDNEIVGVNVGLTKLADKISSVLPQMPIQSQFPKNRVRFLRKIVLEQDWAKASIAQISGQILVLMTS